MNLIHARLNQGFTVLELVAVMAILAIITATAAPNISLIHGQLKSSEDIRELSLILSLARAEAIRLRSTVRINFTASGYSWDIHDDSSTDESFNLSSGSAWVSSTPSSFTFNGLGLARGLASSLQIGVSNKGINSFLTINKNGHIDL